MTNVRRLLSGFCVVLAAVIGVNTGPSSAGANPQVPPSASRRGGAPTNFDAFGSSVARTSMSQRQRDALQAYAKRGTRPEIDARLGVPTTVWAADPGTVAPPSPRDSRPEAAAARSHLQRVAGLYSLSAADVSDAKIARIHNTGHGGVIVQFTNAVNGVEVWHERLNVLMSQDLKLVGLTGFLLPATVVEPRFSLSTKQAVSAAYRDLTGHEVGALSSAGVTSGYEILKSASDFVDPARVKRVMYRQPAGLVAAYYLELSVENANETESFGYVISAADGKVLNRTNLAANDATSYRVWADPNAANEPFDGPQGSAGSPHPNGTPNGYQAPFIPPNLIGGPTSGDPWLPPGADSTIGNNVEAYSDTASPDGFTPGTSDMHAAATGPGVFDHTYDTSLPAAVNSEQTQASITQMFYDANYLHDWFYASGFDEAAGNAQDDNYGRGGIGGDSVQAEVQDPPWAGNNATTSTPADGGRPRIQMGVWAGLTVASLDVTAPSGIASPTALGAASFGPSEFDATSNLVVVNDGTSAPTLGCSALVNAADVAGNIAVVDRGTCSLVTKVKNAQDAGALAVVVVNNQPTGVVTMPGDGSANQSLITIGSFMISSSDGATLKSAIASGPVSVHMQRHVQPTRDSGIDNTVVAHEWAHYMSHRLTASLSNQVSNGMGEGWSDFVALMQTVQPEDVPNLAGAFAVGAYASSYRSADNFYFGIRRVPYSIDFAKDAMTFKDITDGQPLPNVPTLPTDSPNSEVHDTGEVWASMLWESYAALLQTTASPTPRMTFSDARKRMSDYLVASLELTPPDPTFLEGRDALLMVAYANDPVDYQLFAAAFARRGAGAGAVAPDRWDTTNSGVVESYVTDTTAPATAIALLGGTQGNDPWFTAAPIAAVSALDEPGGSHIAAIRCALDGDAPAGYADLPQGPCDFADQGNAMPEGTHTLYAASIDLAGNASPLVSVTTHVDSAPPSSAAALTPSAPDGSNGWYRSAASITVSADDGATGSGALQTRCVLDPSAPPATFDDLPAADCAPSTVSTAGQHTIYLASIDNAGNKELPHSLSFQIDPTPPSTTLSPTPTSPDGNNGWYRTTVSLAVGVNDGSTGSGVAATRCALDPATTPTTFSDLPSGCAVSAISTDGKHTVWAASVDNAGNTETPVSINVSRDTSPPTFTPTITPSGVLTLGETDATASAGAIDATSGVDSQSCDPLDTSTTGTHSLTCYATDEAGNQSQTTVTYQVGQYQILGFYSPVPNSKWKRGTTVPVKIGLAYANGQAVSDTDAKALATASPCRVMFAAKGAQTVAGQCMKYDATRHQFVYNWAIPKTGSTGSETLTASVLYPNSSTVTSKSETVAITN